MKFLRLPLCLLASALAAAAADRVTLTVTHDYNGARPAETITVPWAEINKAKADTDKALVESGAIDGQDVRDRLANDKNSGYQGLPEIVAPVAPVVPDDGQA